MREEKSMREICGESDQMREPPAGCGKVGNYANNFSNFIYSKFWATCLSIILLMFLMKILFHLL
jgi:hypothetical protein